ncbi:MAG: MFS transporter [SAR324 cluster bacterium]|nr:MFS transporter [SAR324 cluster bacterium]
MPKKEKKAVFTALEKKSIYSLSSIFFFRMFGLFLVLPVFSLLALDLEGASPLLIGIAFGGYGLTQALLQIPFGLWSDRIGRKPVIAFGLILFIAGSAIGTVAEGIYWMIFARLLQGAGAISSPIFALIADLTRPEVRARANAGLGASIGMAFGLAFFAAPFLGSWMGLGGIFGSITIMATVSLVILLTSVPTPEQTIYSGSSWSMFKAVLRIPPLLTIDFGALVCSMGLSTTFFMTPLILSQYGFEKSDLWKVYLPMLLLGGIAMVFAAILAEVKKRFREVMLVGAGLLFFSFIFSWLGYSLEMLPLYIAALFMFFMGFNVFEPIFPSLITRMTSSHTKGTASGVYSFSSFMGNFLGAAAAGLLYQRASFLLFLLLIGMTAVFFYLIRSFPNPENTVRVPDEAKSGVAVGEQSY